MLGESKWLFFLTDALKRLSKSNVLDNLLFETINTATEICNTEYGYLELINDNKLNTLDLVVLKGVNKEFINQINQSVRTDKLIKRLFKFKEQQVINNPFSKIKNIKFLFSKSEINIKSIQLTPIYDIDGLPLGVITVLSTAPSNIGSTILNRIKTYAQYVEIFIDRVLKNSALLKINEELELKNNKLLTTIKKANELSIIKNRFVSHASHEFKTPLSTILSSTYLIGIYDKTEDQENRKKHLSRIETNVLHLTETLDNFLTAGTDSYDSTTTVFNLPLFINQILNELSVLCKNNQEIIYEHHGEHDIKINKNILKNIIYNLLSNAIKYSDTNIYMSTTIVKDKIKLKVVDFGIGIPKNEKHKIFNRFYRAKNTNTIKGTGLGLFILKRYIKQLNAKVLLKSDVNEGSTFYISIPLSKT